MKWFLSFVSSCLLVLGLTACGTAREAEGDPAGNAFCFGCHSETSELGKKISWAEAGWDQSVHKNGQIGRLYTQVPDPPGGCAPWPVGACFVAIGQEFEGTNSSYANSSGCQICHTQEGFRKRVAGDYDEAGLYSIKTSWDTRAQKGSPTRTPNTPLTRDIIQFPSPLGCFGCHTPHGIGTPDGKTLPQTIPVGTPVTTQTGAVWDAPNGPAPARGANKAKGHICAECHQIRLNDQPSTADSIVAVLTSATVGAKYNVSAPYGPHHGPQADMLLGEGGAQYLGTTAEGLAFNGQYSNSPHTGIRDADCISCHAQSDFSDIEVTGSFSVTASVGGHSFRNKGFVHGAEKALVIGCGSTGCHKVSGVATSAGNLVEAANITTTAVSEYLQRGDAFFRKRVGTTATAPGTDSNYHLKVSELLAKLARPSAACAGLLSEAAVVAGGAIGWATMEDLTTIDRRCISAGSTTGINMAASPRDDNTNASVRFVKGLWNFKFVLVEDKSFGVHNTTYALQLLYDSCVDLASLTGKTCGSIPGRCSFCEVGVTDVPGRFP